MRVCLSTDPDIFPLVIVQLDLVCVVRDPLVWFNSFKPKGLTHALQSYDHSGPDTLALLWGIVDGNRLPKIV